MAANDFPPAQWLTNRQPWSTPQYIPGAPHNLPARPDPAVAGSTGQAGSAFSGDSVATREPYRYASLVDLSVSVGTASFKFLDQPIGKRNMLGLRNASTGTQNIFIGFGGNATTGSWMKIPPGSLVLFDAVVPQDDLYVIADGASASLSYAYSTFPG